MAFPLFPCWNDSVKLYAFGNGAQFDTEPPPESRVTLKLQVPIKSVEKAPDTLRSEGAEAEGP